MNPFELAPAANAHQARLQLGELGPQPVYDWHGKEALSRCFSLSVTLVCRSPLPPLTTLLQQPATLELHSPKGTRRYVHGLVFDLTELDRSPRHVRYRLTLVPPLALLDL
ncbi:contractile injection system protein, VgrG/Pvc8 family, partial [Oceanimonas smirnovii]|uniref:contractile injection system protein, VgrG/Pvc8 family n=1 Tax=Oceanimonas smirnovii TaxID=264574 RepID=UPI0004778659